ncbi:hypothetical protein A0H81_11671 [Grifola frondosa]|uniref:CCHC-type domain-containing protein n=1 Tax=Grifola frondosa TaxID=5627 RepID=A0A1C7LUT8_GRIFR|nr:hypothetical protein A0H81_11671 [Grifola frondosa]
MSHASSIPRLTRASAARARAAPTADSSAPAVRTSRRRPAPTSVASNDQPGPAESGISSRAAARPSSSHNSDHGEGPSRGPSNRFRAEAEGEGPTRIAGHERDGSHSDSPASSRARQERRRAKEKAVNCTERSPHESPSIGGGSQRSTVATSHARIRANRLASTVQSMNAHREEVRDLLEHLHERDQEISQLLSTIVEEQDHAERTAQIQEDLEMTPPESAAQPASEGMRRTRTRSEQQSEGRERGRRNVRRHVDEDEGDDEEDRETSRRSSRANTAGQWARGIARALANSRPHRLRQAGLAGTQSPQRTQPSTHAGFQPQRASPAQAAPRRGQPSPPSHHSSSSSSSSRGRGAAPHGPARVPLRRANSSQGSQAPPAAGPGANAPPVRRDGGHRRADRNAPAVHHDGVRPRAVPNVRAEDQARPRRQRECDVLALDPDLDDDEEPPVDSIEQIGLHRCLEMIEVMVGEPPMDDPPHYLRISKLAAPSKFEGTDNANAFEVWLQELLEYLATLRVTGPDFDRDRLRMMGSALSGPASRWFFSTIQSPSRERRDWTFEAAVVSMHRRFLHKNVHQIASDKWDQATYSASRGGVADLYEHLNKYAEQMFERPSDFKFRQRFLSALPSGMCEAIVLHQGHSAAMSTFRKIYAAALAYEQGLDMMKALQTKKPSPVTTSGDKSHSRPSHPAGNHAAPRAVAHGAGHRSSQHNAGRDHFRPCHNSDRRDETRHTPGPSGPDRAAKPADQRAPSKPATNTVKCYACGQLGHYSTDPKCPKYGTGTGAQRMFAQRVVDDQSEDETAAVDNGPSATDQTPAANESPEQVDQGPSMVQDYPESDYGFGGSQYSSTDERYVESDISDIDEEAHDDVHFGLMRLAAMRVESHPIVQPKGRIDQLVQTFQLTTGLPARSVRNAWLYDPRVRRITDPTGQPKRSPDLQRTLCAEVMVNGVKAFTLFDSGCTTDSISPEVAYLALADRIDLQEQVGLQLGTKGSRTRINYGARPRIVVGPVNTVHYLDVVDIDRYDLILGTVFCNTYGVSLDFETHTICIKGTEIPAYTTVEEAEILANRLESRQLRMAAHLNAATVQLPPTSRGSRRVQPSLNLPNLAHRERNLLCSQRGRGAFHRELCGQNRPSRRD